MYFINENVKGPKNLVKIFLKKEVSLLLTWLLLAYFGLWHYRGFH